MADGVIWSESARLMWCSLSRTVELRCGRAPRVLVVATEASLTIDLADVASTGSGVGSGQRRIAQIAMRDIRAIELEGRPTSRTSFDWELLTGFAAERDAAVATTGLLIRSYSQDLWVLRLDGDFDCVVPRVAEVLARKERSPLSA